LRGGADSRWNKPSASPAASASLAMHTELDAGEGEHLARGPVPPPVPLWRSPSRSRTRFKGVLTTNHSSQNVLIVSAVQPADSRGQEGILGEASPRPPLSPESSHRVVPVDEGFPNYKLAGFSVERLMNLLTAVDQDVEIVIRNKARSRRAVRIRVVAA
jgi:helix-turn-helix protein